MMPRILFASVVVVLAAAAASAADNQPPVVSDVQVVQREACKGVFDISYDLDDPDDVQCNVYVMVSRDAGASWSSAACVTGDFGPGVARGTGKHVEWDLGACAPGLTCQELKVRIIADDVVANDPDPAKNTTLAPMCFVPAGRFRTGPGVPVFMDDYWIDKFEVTNELYCVFLNAGGNDDHYHAYVNNLPGEIEVTGPSGSYTYHPAAGLEKRPVVGATWYDATDFCAWRSAAEGLPAGSYQLPTEAQWEKAAGWAPGRTVLWTYAFQSDSIDCTRANYAGGPSGACCVGTTSDVGSYTAWKSHYGCHDMTGNVWEWCMDWYGSYPSSRANPTGPTTGSYRVIRSGSWYNLAATCRVDYRGSDPPSVVCDDSGFRAARIPLFAYDASECLPGAQSAFADSAPFFASYVPVNGDCTVNILDLLFIRNRIGQDVFANDNSRADVNSDGRIDLLDLLCVRNMFGRPCSQ